MKREDAKPAKAFLIDGLRQAWAEGSMNFDRFVNFGRRTILGLDHLSTEEIIDFVNQLPDVAQTVEWRELEG